MNVHTDNWDIDNYQRSIMTEVCCLQCQEETTACLQVAYPVSSGDVVLACIECGEELTPSFDPWSGVAQ